MALTEDELAEIRDTFVHFDRDGNGVIDRAEFKSLLEALDPDMTDDDVSAGLEAVDDNHNGRIDFDEFVAWWRDR